MTVHSYVNTEIHFFICTGAQFCTNCKMQLSRWLAIKYSCKLSFCFKNLVPCKWLSSLLLVAMLLFCHRAVFSRWHDVHFIADLKCDGIGRTLITWLLVPLVRQVCHYFLSLHCTHTYHVAQCRADAPRVRCAELCVGKHWA